MDGYACDCNDDPEEEKAGKRKVVEILLWEVGEEVEGDEGCNEGEVYEHEE